MSHSDAKLLFRLAEIERRMNNMIVFGKVAAADYPKARVRVRLSADVITDWLRWQTPRAHDEHIWDAPEIGEQVMVLSPNGELALGVVCPAISFNDYPALFDGPTKTLRRHGDGARVAYDREAHLREVELPAAGTARHIIDESLREQTADTIADTADTITQTAGTAALELRADIGRANLTGDAVNAMSQGGSLRLNESRALLSFGDASIELTASGITFTTATGVMLRLGASVDIGDGSDAKPVARVGDSIDTTTNKITSGAATVTAS